MNITKVYYFFHCGCCFREDQVRTVVTWSVSARQWLRSINPGIRLNRNKRHCPVHGDGVKMRYRKCIDCGKIIENTATAGVVPYRCEDCAYTRFLEQRRVNNKARYHRVGRERYQSASGGKNPRAKAMPKRRWDCVSYERCLFSKNDDPAMCVGCVDYTKSDLIACFVQSTRQSHNPEIYSL